MAILLQTRGPPLNTVELHNKDAVRDFLSKTHWAVFTNDSKFITYWRNKVYDMIEIGIQFVHLLKTKPNYEYELVGIITGTSAVISYMNKVFGGESLECGLMVHEFALSLLLQLAALSGMYDNIKVHEGFSGSVYYIIVYFNDNLKLEDIIKNGVEAITKANN